MSESVFNARIEPSSLQVEAIEQHVDAAAQSVEFEAIDDTTKESSQAVLDMPNIH